ncbi:MAG: elongation factor Ts [Chitinophagaceae bacterium]|nr:elongation factor Ts [Chitinophagaceae bacterium]
MSAITITAADINKLRKQTGAGMLDCRAALEESNGDFEAAIDFLRKKGQKVAAKRSDREANEGLVLAKTNADGKKGFLMNLTSETDFVAKNEDFIKFGLSLLDTAVSNNCNSLEEFLGTKYEAITVGEKLIEQVGVIGEKIEVTQFETIEADSVVAYNHAGYRVAVLVGLNKTGETIVAAGKDVAMQIAAMNPLAVNADSVSPEVVAREKAIIMETMQADPKMAGKPEEMLSKIAEGKIGAFFKENTLLAQAFVKDGSKSVEEFLSSVEKDLTVTEFKRLNIG